jgi:hypothetical protein
LGLSSVVFFHFPFFSCVLPTCSSHFTCVSQLLYHTWELQSWNSFSSSFHKLIAWLPGMFLQSLSFFSLCFSSWLLSCRESN